jgi:crotonobetainyl-CoA:carnitine CoA-transferase CaiB-like acyl-CoA transferase
MTQPTSYWLERLQARGLLGSPIRTVGQAVEDPATRELGLFVELQGYPGIISPRLDNVPHAEGAQPAPLLGEHTAAILTELLEMDGASIQDLVQRGVVGVASGAGAGALESKARQAAQS